MSGEKLQTPYGIFSGITSIDYDPGGKIQGVRLEEQNMILTHAGELIPFYGNDTMRRKYKSSVTFHKNGMIRAVSLEEQQDVMTPIGELPAELVTFYETGELKRVFPLDGKISGFWSEDDERALNIPLTFEFDFASFSALISGICFYKSGDIKSITLYPGESIMIAAEGIGRVPVRNGFSLYENGSLASFEPAAPVSISTPIGSLPAFDPNASGVNADTNSLTLDEQGRVAGLVIPGGRIFARDKSGGVFTFSPMMIDDDDECMSRILPVQVVFSHGDETVGITAADGETHVFRFDDEFIYYPGQSGGCAPDKCASCSLCSGK